MVAYVNQAIPSDHNAIPNAQIMKVPHTLFHELILCCACAMAGIIRCGISVQCFGVSGQRFVQGELGKMETADANIRTEPVHDVQDAPVGAPAEKNSFSVFHYQQVLFVAEIIFRHASVLDHVQTAGAKIHHFRGVMATVYYDSFRNWHVFID